MKKTYFIKTFGCQLNFADSERVASALEKQGYQPAENIEKADLVVINSCIVRESAENRVYGLINKIVQRHPELVSGSELSIPKQVRNDQIHVILTGCLAGWALRNSRTNLNKLRKRIGDKVEIKLIEDIANFDIQPRRESEDWGYVPISNGCNHFCSYCIVPYARGREIYRSAEDIIKDVHCALKQGYKKIMLLGQNVNTWENLPQAPQAGWQGTENFAELLEAAAKIEGVEEITFMSANPRDFSDELINVISQNKNISREIHLPVQSGNNQILEKMNRGYTRENYINLVEKIKEKVPEAEITTDLLVGFPGETETAFQNTVDLCKQVGFKRAFINKYSPRPGTAAAENFEDSIPHPTKKKRWRILEKMINDY
jgi:tRNA-2-methylthio-N6-dimethylallyladenosine synthase